ncbi:glycosyltransferase family protein [Pontibacter vulgaris]|uniref:glycosyltransferase family protein n=1 Tax=Pontibacter vulgaris TaxID=2905679 RepID=UPI001FA74408|nr:glycosyltransferase family protein [Pontibacter vulgaris]
MVNPPHIGAVIQVRLGSERLPNKALLPLPFGGGPALLDHVIIRALESKLITSVVVATTDTSKDNAIAIFCQAKGITCYRGSEENVLDRFYQAARQKELDVVVRLTGDNPCIVPAILDKAITTHISQQNDYTRTEGLPLGTNLEIMAFAALEQAHEHATETFEHEHVTPYLYSSKQDFKVAKLDYSNEVNMQLQNVRLTVDYPSDFAMLSLLLEKVNDLEKSFSFQAMEEVLQKYPWLPEINSSNSQKKVYFSEEVELADAKSLLMRYGMEKAATVIENYKTHES